MFPHSWLISPDWPCSKFFPQRLRWPEITEGQRNWNRVTAKWASFHGQAKPLNSISLRCRLLRCALVMCRGVGVGVRVVGGLGRRGSCPMYCKCHNSFTSWKSAVNCQSTQVHLISRIHLNTESYAHSCVWKFTNRGHVASQLKINME